jgi:hypothetical protein
MVMVMMYVVMVMVMMITSITSTTHRPQQPTAHRQQQTPVATERLLQFWREEKVGQEFDRWLFLLKGFRFGAEQRREDQKRGWQVSERGALFNAQKRF